MEASWSWQNPIQAYEYLEQSIGSTANTLLPDECYGRGMGLFHAIAETGLELAMVITMIGEATIKGIGNIFGAACNDGCSLKEGLCQLFLFTPLFITYKALTLPYIIVAQSIKLVVYPIWALADQKSLRDFINVKESLPVQISKPCVESCVVTSVEVAAWIFC